MEEFVAFCLVAFLAGDSQTVLEQPWPKYHTDINMCMSATGELGGKLATAYATESVVVDITCGCLGKAEAQRLGIVPADDESNVEIRD
jgi:hypothetical protein|tara:strand:- start:3571 stop:3834 length:264 start_codon:yes stop_codon:yes gene_type:complete